MESENKKKKNKKKKNKQAKNVEDSAGAGRTVHLEHNHLAASEQNFHPQISSGEVEISLHSESEGKLYHHKFDESINSQTLTKLEGELTHLETEKKYLLQKEIILEEKIKRLEYEKKSWAAQEISLKETTARLAEANIELKREVNELKESKDHLLQERHELMTRISDLELHMQQLNSNLALHVEARHTATDSDVAKGKCQIIPEDEQHRIPREETNALVEKLMAQNEELMGKVNELHVQIDQLKSPPRAATTAEVPTTQVGISTLMLHDATGAMKPSKHIETPTFTSFDVRSAESPTISMSIPIHSASTSVQTPAFPAKISPLMVYPPESSEKTDVPFQEIGLPPNQVELETDNIVHHGSSISSEVRLHEVPTFDNIEIVEDTESQSKLGEDKNTSTEPVVEEKDVSLIDSPLIGAPFRLLGFMARYVSGADLVNTKRSSI